MSLPPESADPRFDAEVIVVGAGPAGLMAANLLGGYGVRVVVIESGDELIDYPRGVGMDDETLRTFQSVGLADAVLPHTVPNQLLVFVDSKGKDLARIAPPMADFGWPRRNGFVQPLADRVLLEGLQRFNDVRVLWSSTVTGMMQDGSGVTLTVEGPDGVRELRAQYVVGADGGRSATRKAMGIGFPGTTASTDWLVVDIRDDPLGHPGAYVGADPRRPYASISIPHGIRRFEFMIKKGETAADAERDEFIEELLAPFIPRGSRVDIIRRRVYAHQSRIAERFREGRVFLVGDAAHLMPVWQGQGYNSGLRDSFNLAWKLAMVVRGQADQRLLDTYDLERRDHVKAMIQLSTWVGRVISVTNRFTAAARNVFLRTVSLVPRLKTYIVQMRFKPMPTIREGAISKLGAATENSPVGRLFPQPMVTTRDGGPVRMDDAIGNWFALIAWNNNPAVILDEGTLREARAAGIRLIAARPAVQLAWDEPGSRAESDVKVVGDADGTLKKWFDVHPESVVLVRPDRIVGGAAPVHGASQMVSDFLRHASAPAEAAASTRASRP
ncbi:bifunctional 3-(3-hydroxy-phenyl)propionate/3-hydroxycinnamic acid hydroxylase [Microbacterium sp. 22303]|uniref:bifunctional 3-(3-hydroxy-phenyl)propionate/3-hydroxycinnamic acid hydroxylase n=1 Tax=Microbacterium sp. 22303 TaxID=3453905 RepID=UPI003F85D103